MLKKIKSTGYNFKFCSKSFSRFNPSTLGLDPKFSLLNYAQLKG